MTERVVVFVDGSNFYHALKNDFGDARLDLSRLVEKLLAGRSLVRVYYYNAPLDQAREPQRAKDQQRFFDQIQRLPYFSLKLGRLEPRGPVYVEKGVDIVIAVDLLRFAYNNVYDTAILVSGVPHLNRQIAAGGPVTVTHAEVKRYFMTIPEVYPERSRRTVGLAEGAGLRPGDERRALRPFGELRVGLDMGEPVKIADRSAGRSPELTPRAHGKPGAGYDRTLRPESWRGHPDRIHRPAPRRAAL